MNSIAEPTLTGSKDPKRALHRVGSLLVKDLDEPKTIGQRITARRLALGLSQQEVADRCWITQKNNSNITGAQKGDRKRLSRSAYCMYETDSVTPVIDVLEQIADALELSREYVFFGTPTIQELRYNPHEDDFAHKGHWTLDPAWVKREVHTRPGDLMLCTVTEDGIINDGDMAIVRRDAEPGRTVEPFVYAMDGKATTGFVSRPQRAGPYLIYASGKAKKHTREAGAFEINILGKLVGSIAGR